MKGKKQPEVRPNRAIDEFNNNCRDLSPFFNFIEISPIYMHVYCNDKIVYANKAVLDKLEYSLDEMLQMNFWDVVHPDYIELVREIGRSRQIGMSAPSRTEFKVISKSGKEVWVDVFTSVETINGQNYVLVGGYDITDRRKVQAELQKARDELEQRVLTRTLELQRSNEALTLQRQMLMGIISNISDGVIIVNRQGNIEFCNPTMEKMLHLTHDEIVQDYVSGKLSFNDTDVKKMLKNRTPFKDEEAVISLAGREEMRFLISGTPINDHEGSISKGIIVLRPLAEVHRLVNRINGAVARFVFKDIITNSAAMEDTIQTAEMASTSISNVLIEGESGTGKELFAQAIHNHSPRAEGPFIAVNCGTIPRELIGSELFGYEEGIFTGARKGGNAGKFELAAGGTLFLDEIGDMPIEHQVTLLRVLQEKQLTRIGGSKVIPIDVRIICATHRDLYMEVQNEHFQRDLFYRLNVINLRIPPLRERKEDIPMLFKHFLMQMDGAWTKHFDQIETGVEEALLAYNWPGNVRELQNLAERLAYAQTNYEIRRIALPREIAAFLPESSYENGSPTNIKGQLTDLESRQIASLLQKHHGNVTRVAEEIGISSRTVYRKIKKYQLDTKKATLE
ncbi:MAG TPA: sigma 54-interacting transcriptional regulator [Syntrophomonadaceae bacterium]|nr:sigma 54-interacting transcriptional regulator [Syntrophomonadaceae bacterium]